ncbi:MAG: alpha/beta hydrolase [Candidatus Hydrogenedentes bacterium]|nr:alpha/beta hydrolase [Candidatus Hydrogenedentota bacterium]
MSRRWMQFPRRIGFAIAATVIGGCVLLWAFQESLIFPASKQVWRTPADPPFGWTYERITLNIGNDRTDAWYIPVENPEGVILLSHGNGGNIADRIEHYAMLRDLRYDIFTYDYGGYGNSTGRPSEKRCYADIRAAWNYLTKSRGVSEKRIVLYGESLGGGATCELATEVKPRAVVLQCTFLSVSKIAKEVFPIVPVNLLLKHRFDNESKIGNISVPKLFIHSQADTIIPYKHGRRLFDLATEPKMFLDLRGDHNDCIFTSEQTYREGMKTFLDSL